MKIHDVIQGSNAWLRLRAGVPTSSEFDKIVTPTGKASKSAEGYRHRLLAERCMRHPVREYISLHMERGSDMEIDAVRFYELQADVDTTPVGFVTNDAGTIGASPDRLVGEDGLLEIKCPSEAVHMAYLLTAGGAYETYKVQVNGQLWVTGRKFVDVLSFHPELPPALIRMERDEKFIGLLAELVTEFSVELEKQYQFVLERGWVKSQEEVVAEQLHASLSRLAPLDELVKQARYSEKTGQ